MENINKNPALEPPLKNELGNIKKETEVNQIVKPQTKIEIVETEAERRFKEGLGNNSDTEKKQ